VTEEPRRGLVVPGHSENGRLSPRCSRLLARAAELAEEREPAVVVFSGWSPIGTPSEAEQMLEAWPGRRDVELVAEPTARNTAENASRSLPLLLERGVREATVVCAPLHVPRVRYFFCNLYERYGISCGISTARCAPTPTAFGWELAALTVARRQRLAALAELETGRGWSL
jgi:uncharacterized SAM-binding protein YcdF (DUF218 family)